MPCPYLEGEILKKCAVFSRPSFTVRRDPATAGKGARVLTLGELKDYCTREEAFEKCKFFNQEKLDEEKTMQDDWKTRA